MSDPSELTPEKINEVLDEIGWTGIPDLDGLRVAAHVTGRIDVQVIATDPPVGEQREP